MKQKKPELKYLVKSAYSVFFIWNTRNNNVPDSAVYCNAQLLNPYICCSSALDGTFWKTYKRYQNVFQFFFLFEVWIVHVWAEHTHGKTREVAKKLTFENRTFFLSYLPWKYSNCRKQMRTLASADPQLKGRYKH